VSTKIIAIQLSKKNVFENHISRGIIDRTCLTMIVSYIHTLRANNDARLLLDASFTQDEGLSFDKHLTGAGGKHWPRWLLKSFFVSINLT
jgi:hypothetical protein